LNNLILIGFKNAGKTTLALKLAKRLKRTFVDTDDLIAPNCSDFYRQIGEVSFRLIEKKILYALSGIEGCVIATGGGVVLDADNTCMLRKMGRVIYVATPKEELEKRLLCKPYPAFFDLADPSGSFEKMYLEREKRYLQTADIVVRSEKELWEAIDSDLSLQSPPGESPTARRSAL